MPGTTSDPGSGAGPAGGMVLIAVAIALMTGVVR
jgi:hypothetical protein